MGFIEDLRREVERKITAKEQTDQAEGILRLDQQRQRQLQEINESAFHKLRREQTRTFRREGRIDKILSSTYALVKRDPTTYEPKGHVALFTPRGVSNYPEKDADFEAVSAKARPLLKSQAVHAINKHRYDLTLDPDSLFDVVFLGSETGIPSNAIIRPYSSEDSEPYYVKYLMVETNPDGDIVFHSRRIVPDPHFPIKYEHRAVALAVWRSDKSVLDSELDQAYTYPDDFSVFCEIIPSGGFKMLSAGNG